MKYYELVSREPTSIVEPLIGKSVILVEPWQSGKATVVTRSKVRFS